MQVTTANYFEVVSTLSLPEQFTRPHNMTVQASANNWQAYRENETIKRVTNLYFEKLAEYAIKGQKTRKTSIPRKYKPSGQEKNKKEKALKEPVSKKVKSENNGGNNPAKKVELLHPEIVFIRRYVGLHNKEKSKNAILTFIRSLQKAIVQKAIRKTSAHADSIRTIQDKLVKHYNSMQGGEKIVIAEPDLSRLVAIGGGEEVYKSITIIKRYVGAQGKEVDAKKITAFIKFIDKAAIPSGDPYADKVKQIIKALKKALQDKQSHISIDTYELNGLSSILSGCGCKACKNGLDGLDTIDSGIMTGRDLMRMQYQTYGFNGDFAYLLGDPAIGFSAMIHGKPGQGKSTFGLQLAHYLAKHHGKVMYVSSEEYGSYTLRDKVARTGGASQNLHFAPNFHSFTFSEYSFIFLDSVNHLGLSYIQFKELKAAHPKTAFILIMQATKEGNYKGDQEWEHEVDTVIRLENGLAQTTKNRYAPLSSIQIF